MKNRQKLNSNQKNKKEEEKTNSRGRSKGGGIGRGGRRGDPAAPLFKFKELSG